MFLEKIEMLGLRLGVISGGLKKFSAFVLIFALGQLVVSGLFSLDTFVIARGDAAFYFGASSRVSELTSFEQLYSGYIYLLHASQFFSESGTLMVLIQSLFVILAGYALFSITEEIGGSRAAWISVSFYFLLPLLSQWTRYILTESIFYALIIIGMRLATLRKGNWNRFLLFPVIGLMIFLRPNGIVIACAVVTVLLISNSKSNAVRAALVVIIWVCGAVFTLSFLSENEVGQESVQSSIFVKTLEGNVVFGVEETKYKMPPPLSEDRSNKAFVKYISQYPVDNLRLGALRLFWELKQVRPWYSTSLNLFISIVMGSFYLFTLLGLFRVRNKLIVRAAVTLTVPSAILIAGTWAIWEGRFAWWMLICWIPFFAVGISGAFEHIFCQVRRIFFLESDRPSGYRVSN